MNIYLINKSPSRVPSTVNAKDDDSHWFMCLDLVNTRQCGVQLFSPTLRNRKLWLVKLCEIIVHYCSVIVISHLSRTVLTSLLQPATHLQINIHPMFKIKRLVNNSTVNREKMLIMFHNFHSNKEDQSAHEKHQEIIKQSVSPPATTLLF